MSLNYLETLGVLMIFLMVSLTVIFIYYTIKDFICKWKRIHQIRCPFCKSYLHGYRTMRKGAKFDAQYCSRCGKLVNDKHILSSSGLPFPKNKKRF